MRCSERVRSVTLAALTVFAPSHLSAASTPPSAVAELEVVRRRSRPVGMKPAVFLALGFVMTLTACDYIRGQWWDWRERAFERRERAFRADMDRISKDTQRAYQLDYVLSHHLQAMLDTRTRFRALQNGQFDMLPWLRENGLEATPISRAIFDPEKRKITIIDTGPNISLIEWMMEPLRPDSYHAIKTLSSPNP